MGYATGVWMKENYELFVKPQGLAFLSDSLINQFDSPEWVRFDAETGSEETVEAGLDALIIYDDEFHSAGTMANSFIR